MAGQVSGRFEWYATVSAKFSRSDELTRKLSRWNAEADKVLNAQRAAVDHQKQELAADLKRLEQERSTNESERDTLRKRLDTYLPSWLRGLVSPEEMFTFYAPLLLSLAIVVAFKALLVRRHFTFFRDRIYPDHLARRDPSLSSSWTLVYRGPAGTMATAILFLGGTLLLWLVFEWGFALTQRWSLLLPDTEVGAVEWSVACLWLGGYCSVRHSFLSRLS